MLDNQNQSSPTYLDDEVEGDDNIVDSQSSSSSSSILNEVSFRIDDDDDVQKKTVDSSSELQPLFQSYTDSFLDGFQASIKSNSSLRYTSNKFEDDDGDIEMQSLGIGRLSREDDDDDVQNQNVSSWYGWKAYLCFSAVTLIILAGVIVFLVVNQPRSPPSPASVLPTQSPTTTFSTSQWLPLGRSLPGADGRDEAGFAVSLSNNGNIVVVGSRRASPDGILNRGSVSIYEFQFNRWTNIETLSGNAERNQFGFSVSISGNGRRVAIGSIGDDTNGRNSGKVQVFELENGQWTQIGQFFGRHENNVFGVSVSMSEDGRLVAVGAPYYNASPELERNGQVKFFEDIGFDTPRWIEGRARLDGTNSGDWFGWAVSLSSDGNHVAIGAPGDPKLNKPGYARAFRFTGINDEWQQQGRDLVLGGNGDRCGYSLSMDGSGNRLAVGAYRGTTSAPNGTPNNNTVTNETIATEARGQVNVYRIRGKDWVLLGNQLIGNDPGDDFGYSVSLTIDGEHLAVGAPNRKNNPGTGLVRVYNLQEDLKEWVPSNDITSDTQSSLGFSVSLSVDATRVAVGLPLANMAQIYERVDG